MFAERSLRDWSSLDGGLIICTAPKFNFFGGQKILNLKFDDLAFFTLSQLIYICRRYDIKLKRCAYVQILI